MRLQTSMPLATANEIVTAALRLGREADLLPLTVVVLDAGGKPVAMQSEDGAGIVRFDVALGKAWGALGMGMSSRLIRDRMSARVPFMAALSAASDGGSCPCPAASWSRTATA